MATILGIVHRIWWKAGAGKSDYLDIADTHLSYSSLKELKSMEDVEDVVIPIRLELEHEQYKIKDTFMWNCAGEF